MKNVYEVTFVQKTKNPKYAKVCGLNADTGKCFNELYGKMDTKPLAVGDHVTLSYSHKNDKYYTFVNPVKK